MSVVLATRDGGRHLAEAVDSVFAQSEQDFELIVVDDGSTDGSVDELRRARPDARLVVVPTGEGSGLTAALRTGMAHARGTFVARMDADDIAHPLRFERQLALLEGDPRLGVVGAACVVIDEAGRQTGTIDPPLTPLAVRWRALLENPLVHPAVLLRTSLLRERNLEYDPAYRTAQDYELWTRVLEHCDGANSPERLLSYRVHDATVTARSRDSQLETHTAISLRTIRRWLPGITVSEGDVVGLRRLLVERSVTRGDGTPLQSLVRAHHGLLTAFAHSRPTSLELAELVTAERRRLAQALWAAASVSDRLSIVLADPTLAPSVAGLVTAAGGARLRRLLKQAP